MSSNFPKQCSYCPYFVTQECKVHNYLWEDDTISAHVNLTAQNHTFKVKNHVLAWKFESMSNNLFLSQILNKVCQKKLLSMLSLTNPYLQVLQGLWPQPVQIRRMFFQSCCIQWREGLRATPSSILSALVSCSFSSLQLISSSRGLVRIYDECEFKWSIL